MQRECVQSSKDSHAMATHRNQIGVSQLSKPCSVAIRWWLANRSSFRPASDVGLAIIPLPVTLEWVIHLHTKCHCHSWMLKHIHEEKWVSTEYRLNFSHIHLNYSRWSSLLYFLVVNLPIYFLFDSELFHQHSLSLCNQQMKTGCLMNGFKKRKEKAKYSQLSPCRHVAITDTPIIRTAAKSPAK